ncbi:hypothetical protein V4R08_07185 [Nitrobacter sp. NHB1]|uniref:hypothetical protein n=1 Tax=Nitrobacter sp. NHB1 TaxID=3119830 RepID=UPI002FFF2788
MPQTFRPLRLMNEGHSMVSRYSDWYHDTESAEADGLTCSSLCHPQSYLYQVGSNRPAITPNQDNDAFYATLSRPEDNGIKNPKQLLGFMWSFESDIRLPDLP